MKVVFSTKILAAAIGLALASAAHAATFTLSAVNGTIVDGNTTSAFYEVSGAGVESGSAVANFSSALGGSSTIGQGFWVDFTLTAGPKPVLTSAFLKAGDQYLLWDSTDLAAWNSTAVVGDVLRLLNNGITNPPGNNYLGTSHAGLVGTPGTTTVPDGGSALMMLGAGLAAVALIRRRFIR